MFLSAAALSSREATSLAFCTSPRAEATAASAVATSAAATAAAAAALLERISVAAATAVARLCLSSATCRILCDAFLESICYFELLSRANEKIIGSIF